MDYNQLQNVYNKIKPKKYPLNVWLEKLVTHQVVIPEFQRPIVWTASKVERLLNSIFGGFYIGSFLVFKPKNILEFKFHPLKGSVACKQSSKEHPLLLLLDGQQRSFSLLYGLCGLWNKNIFLLEKENGTKKLPYIFFVGLKNLLEHNYDRIVVGIPFEGRWKTRKIYREFLRENEGKIAPTSVFFTFP